MPAPAPTPDAVRRRLESGYYARRDVIACLAEAMLPALLGEGGDPAPARRPRRATPPPTVARTPAASRPERS